ncbi:AAA family ATPase [Kineococcus sp. SYSU DK005]|uniref:AAA family ATPase n=1 Tax=Kineococcus sp. SYSU DK005 TaxID=3383126 RepID=UPI003D7E4E6D
MRPATAVLMVGLPGAGKTTRARHLEQHLPALRLSPDEWMTPLYGDLFSDLVGDPQAAGKRDVLEGRLLWTALRAAEQGLNVIIDFGLWAREERHALHQLFTAVGARCRTEYLAVDPHTQLARVRARAARTPGQAFALSAQDLARWREDFEEPTAEELAGALPPAAPPPHRSWAAWAAARWPSLCDTHADSIG